MTQTAGPRFAKSSGEETQGCPDKFLEPSVHNRAPILCKCEEQNCVKKYDFGGGCRISLVSTEPQLVRPSQPSERNWVAIGIAAAVVVVVVVILLIAGRDKGSTAATPITAPLDPYAANLVISNLQMSQSSNMAGGQLTYIDGHIVNNGTRTVMGISAQTLFRNPVHEVAQNETQPMKFIRVREPYIDVEPVSSAPLKPGDGQDFRLIFDTLADTWDGAYPEIRLIHVDAR